MELNKEMRLETDQYIIESEDATIDVTSHGYYMEFKIVAYTAKVTNKEVTVVANTPELYYENLEALKNVMGALDGLVSIDGVFDLEIRVKVDDVEAWAVIGYGESGDPCVLRFE